MAEPIKCPKCPDHPPMHEEEVEGVHVHACKVCGGIWLNKGELNALAHPAEGDLEYCSADHIEEDRVTDRLCPTCPETRLIRVNFIAYSEIVMDFCRKCEGIWLDRGELDAITAEVQGLDKVPESWDHKIMMFLAKLPF